MSGLVSVMSEKSFFVWVWLCYGDQSQPSGVSERGSEENNT